MQQIINASAKTFNYSRKFNHSESDIHDIANNSSAHGLYSYCHKPLPVFHGGNAETCLMYGVELETDDHDYPDEFSTYLHDRFGEHVYCKHDGSLSSGVEIVSHPATLAYHMRKFGWADILAAADAIGAKSHDTTTCGLHIHVGRAALGNTDDARELCIAKLLILMERFYETALYKFSRRRSLDAMARWSRKTDACIVAGDKKDKVLSKSKLANCRNDRYTALNLTNTSTIEFRIFRGTLNPATFAATLQLVDAMVRYCKTHTLQQVIGCKFGDIVAECKYAELAAYCRTRGIDIGTTAAA